jgi:hypothetical protein
VPAPLLVPYPLNLYNQFTKLVMYRYRPPDFDGHPPVPIRVHEPPPDKPTYFSHELVRLLGPQPPNPVIMDPQEYVRTSPVSTSNHPL